MANQLIDLTGRRFTRLTVLGRAKENASNGKARWHCACECGNRVTVRSDKLLSGNTTSCKCRQRELHTTHGQSQHPLYHAYHRLLQVYPDEICFRWRTGFITFWNDMSPTWKPELTLLRLDKNKPFHPDNCIWGTRRQQSQNRVNAHHIDTPNGRMPLILAAEEHGIEYYTLYSRVIAKQWPAERWFEPPANRSA